MGMQESIMTLIHDPYSQSHRRLPRFLSDRRHEREPYHNLAHAERFTLESTRLCSENNLRHLLLRYIPTVRAEDPGTLNVPMNTRKSRSRTSKSYLRNTGYRNGFVLRFAVTPTCIWFRFRRCSDPWNYAENTFDTESSNKYALILR